METNLEIQAMWHVLCRIKNSPTDSTNAILFNLYNFGADSDALNSELQHAALVKLRDQGIIIFDDYMPTAFIERHTNGDIALQYTQYTLTLANNSELSNSYEQYRTLAQTLATKKPVTIDYDNTHAYINGVSFALRGRNKKIFDLLYKHANQWVSQTDLLKTLRYDKGYGSKAANLDFNAYIGNLRKALNLKSWHIAVSNKHVMLKCSLV